MNKPIAVLFAGPAGCGKTQVSHHLSWNMGIPIFSNDVIRTEFKTPTSLNKPADYEKVRDTKLKKLLKKKKSFVFDASIDRLWDEYKELICSSHRVYVISFDLSYGFYKDLVFGKYGDEKRLAKWYKEHGLFLRKNPEIVSFSIADDDYKDRLEIVLDAVGAEFNSRI